MLRKLGLDTSDMGISAKFYCEKETETDGISTFSLKKANKNIFTSAVDLSYILHGWGKCILSVQVSDY